jgi:hypothetical protein
MIEFFAFTWMLFLIAMLVRSCTKGDNVELQEGLEVVMKSDFEVCSRNGYRLCSKQLKDKTSYSILNFNTKGVPPEETFDDLTKAISSFYGKSIDKQQNKV